MKYTYKKLGNITNSLSESLYKLTLTDEDESDNKLYIILNKEKEEEEKQKIKNFIYYLLNIYNTKFESNSIPNQINKLLKTKNTTEWVDCRGECFKSIKQSIDTELNTTLYYLVTLTKSLLTLIEDKFIVCFQINPPAVIRSYWSWNWNGNWNNDSLNINIVVLEVDNPNDINTTYTSQMCSVGTSRLIMGFGPSASGKTYIAKKIINLMTLITQTFPQFFLSIDGGIYRETSKTYKQITNTFLHNSQTKGLTNLVCSTEILGLCTSLFDSNVIKNNIKQYLTHLKDRYTFVISLYIPDTIAFCGVINTSCETKYNYYKEYTEDSNWVGTLIYQHKTEELCRYKGTVYQCLGTTTSGKSRELTEGKKYSSNAWKASFDNGYREFQKAKFAFLIHNCGKSPVPGDDYDKQPKTRISDFSTPQITMTSAISGFLRDNYFILFNKREEPVDMPEVTPAMPEEEAMPVEEVTPAMPEEEFMTANVLPNTNGGKTKIKHKKNKIKHNKNKTTHKKNKTHKKQNKRKKNKTKNNKRSKIQ
jgi:hypothetical protein